MTIISIIQARTSSTRLPDKVLIDIKGKTVLEHVIDRVKQSKKINDVIVATTKRDDDLRIANICRQNEIRVYQGAEDDVLDRYYQIAKLIKPDHIVRITADCPVIDSQVIDHIIESHLDNGSDYTSNTMKPTYPDGQDVEVFTYSALCTSWENANLASEREHVTPFIKKNPGMFKINNVSCKENLGNKRWTLDEDCDLKFVQILFEQLYDSNSFFGMDDILGYLSNNPDIEDINRNIVRDEGYLKSLENDNVLL